MKALVLALLLVIPTVQSVAQEPTPSNNAFEVLVPLTCGPVQEVLNMLKNAGEDMIFIAEAPSTTDERLFASVWINQQTQTWTMLMTNKERMVTCILGSGTNFAMFNNDKMI